LILIFPELRDRRREIRGQDGILLLAFSPYVRWMSEVGMVRSLIEQVLSLGFRIRTVALDSGFYSVGAARCISRFKFISAVPVGDVKAGIHGEFDGRHGTRSKGPAADERVDFRPIVSRRRGPGYVAGATNLELPGRDVLGLYDGIGAPMRHPTGTYEGRSSGSSPSSSRRPSTPSPPSSGAA